MSSVLSPSVQPPPWIHTTSGRSEQSSFPAAGRYTSRLLRLAGTPSWTAYVTVARPPHGVNGVGAAVVVDAGGAVVARSLAHPVARAARVTRATALTRRSRPVIGR